MAHKARTCLWFLGQAQPAAEFYVSLLPDSAIEQMHRPMPMAPPMVVEFALGGAGYLALNGPNAMPHSAAASIHVLTEDQVETDKLWAALTSQGGAAGKCGWLTDRFGVSWQIIPRILQQLLADPNRLAAQRAFQAMLTMQKLDIAALTAAFDPS